MSLFITPIPKLSIIFFSLPSFGFERVRGDCYRTIKLDWYRKKLYSKAYLNWCDSNRPLQDAKHKIVNA